MCGPGFCLTLFRDDEIGATLTCTDGGGRKQRRRYSLDGWSRPFLTEDDLIDAVEQRYEAPKQPEEIFVRLRPEA